MCRNLRKPRQKWHISKRVIIRNSSEDRQLWIALLTINEGSGKKSTLRAKLKAVCQKESGKNISRICSETLLKSLINLSKLDIKLGQFMEEELDSYLKKKKN